MVFPHGLKKTVQTGVFIVRPYAPPSKTLGTLADDATTDQMVATAAKSAYEECVINMQEKGETRSVLHYHTSVLCDHGLAQTEYPSSAHQGKILATGTNKTYDSVDNRVPPPRRGTDGVGTGSARRGVCWAVEESV